MFTGIIEKTGKLKKIEKRGGKIYFTIFAPNFLKETKVGSSIACDGVCLTVIKKKKDEFIAELMPETLKVTKFKNTKVGDEINLERSLKIGDRLDGHFVSGHVDGIGKVKEIVKEGKYLSIIISVSPELNKFLAYKGSAAVNGVSLTISGSGKNWFKVSLITHTLNITNLSGLKVESLVNIEVDLIARYLEKFKNFK